MHSERGAYACQHVSCCHEDTVPACALQGMLMCCCSSNGTACFALARVLVCCIFVAASAASGLAAGQLGRSVGLHACEPQPPM